MLRIIKTSKTPTDCPSKVPLSIVRPHEAQALKNHGQTLDHLNQRGGVSIQELHAILMDRPYDHTVTEQEAIDFVKAQVVDRDEAAEIFYTQLFNLDKLLIDSEQLIQEMVAYTEMLKRRNQKMMGLLIGIVIGFFLWMIYIFGWLV